MRNGNQKLNMLAAGLCGLLLAGVACGDDGNGKLSTGVDKNRPLGMTTPGEAEQICRSTETWATKAFAGSKQKEQVCKISGLFVVGVSALGPDAAATTDAQLQAACKTTRDQCLAGASAADPGVNPAMCTGAGFPADCTATVAEYEACVNDMPPFIDSTAATLPACETVNRLSLLSLLALVNSVPASCRTFQMKCGGAGLPGIPGIPTAP
jgi:hypothetical protein